MTFEQWLTEAVFRAERERAHGVRVGQSMYNALFVHRPDLAARVSGKPELDPFYDDKVVGPFLTHVAVAW